MLHISNQIGLLLVFMVILNYTASSQDSTNSDVPFEINRVYPSLVISPTDLTNAQSISDLNHRFESSWIREYIRVEVVATHAGKASSSFGIDSLLTVAQKQLMDRADTGSQINVIIKYMPENTLSQNDPKQLDFSFVVAPVKEAEYQGGQAELYRYIREYGISQIASNTFVDYDLTSITFTINETGEVTNARVYGQEYKSSPDDSVDALLLEVIKKMPCWIPATYEDGTLASQNFVLNVGNMNNCMINTLNINKDGKPSIK